MSRAGHPNSHDFELQYQRISMQSALVILRHSSLSLIMPYIILFTHTVLLKLGWYG